jgi:hypothetical protein
VGGNDLFEDRRKALEEEPLKYFSKQREERYLT